MGPDFHVWAYRGIIRPLDDLISANNYDTSVFYPAGIDSCTYRGHLVAIPQDTHPGTVCIYWNNDLLSKLGVTPPTSQWNYDEMVEMAKKLTRDDNKDGVVDLWGYSNWNSLRHHYPRLRALGGQHFDPEGTMSLADREPNRQMLRQEWDLIWKHKVKPVPGAAEDADVLYRSSKLAIQNKTPTHVISMTKATEKEFRTEACLIPKDPQTGKIGTATTGIGYCMTTLAKHPEAVWRYLEWLGSHWYGVEAFMQGFTGPGGRRDTWGDPEVIKRWPLAKEIAGALETAEAEEVPANLRFQEVNAAYGAQVGEMLLNRMTPDECAERIKREVDDIMSQPII
jgi:multiple sugar transport system substrate-binding protein